ncbi:acetyltransferase, partial [Metarhizium majus ARSEF 297]
MPHPVARLTPPGKGKGKDKSSDCQEKRQFLEEKNHKKRLPDGDKRLNTLHAEDAIAEDDDSSETLSNGLPPDARKLDSYDESVLDHIESFSDDPWQVLSQCYEIPWTILFGNVGRQREDAEVEAVKELIRQAEAVGLIGGDVRSEEHDEIPIDLDGRSILDRGDALWDRLVLGSVPFDFGDGALDKANVDPAGTDGQDENCGCCRTSGSDGIE